MRVRQYRFDDTIRLFNIGDIHRGDKCCDVKAFHRVVEEVRRSDDAYWVSTGDLLNVALKTSLSDCYSSLSLEDEKAELIKELSPIAHKCLGFVGSNHHRRLSNATGLNLDKVIANELKIPYLGKIGLINVTCGRASYFIAMHHGTGGGKRRGGKVNNLEDLASLIPGADVYMEGHTHAFAHFIDEHPYIDRKRNIFSSHPAHFITTGHYLKWDDSYAQDYKLRPMPIGSSIIQLFANGVGVGKNKMVKVDFFQ